MGVCTDDSLSIFGEKDEEEEKKKKKKKKKGMITGFFFFSLVGVDDYDDDAKKKTIYLRDMYSCESPPSRPFFCFHLFFPLLFSCSVLLLSGVYKRREKQKKKRKRGRDDHFHQ